MARVLPPHYADQETLIAAFKAHWGQHHFNVERLEQLHRNVRVTGRYLALPLSEYPALDRFARRNQVWLEIATELGEAALRNALDRAGVAPREVDHVFFVTVTGIATPTIDARLCNRLGLRPDVKRTPAFGLGCVAGAAGTARAADYLRAFPGEIAVLLSVELCSLTLQREDVSVANVIASGLFGDGAAAVVLSGADRPAGGPKVVATRSVFYPDTERMMGWDVVDAGLKVVLSSRVPELVRARIRADVDEFLSGCGVERGQIRHWVAHTGGPKVLQAFEESLALPGPALRRSWESLERTGNLSSASVLFVLGELLDSGEPREGDLGLLLAMGPGFCAELVLLQW